MKKHTALVSCFSVFAVLIAGGCASSQPAEMAVHRPNSEYPQVYDIQVGAPAFVDVTKNATPDMMAPAVSSGVAVNAPVTAVSASGAPVSVDASTAVTTRKIVTLPKKKLYYQVMSAVPVKAVIYQRATADAPRIMINELQGTQIVSWVKPDYAELEFEFSPLTAGTSAQVKFIVSDRELVK